MTDTNFQHEGKRAAALFRLIGFSAIGIFLFFVPVTIGERSTLLIDHAASAIARNWRPVAVTFVSLLIAYGALAPFMRGTWKSSRTCCRSSSTGWCFPSA